MSFVLFNTPTRRPGKPRDARLHLLALEYLLAPRSEQPGLQKVLAAENRVDCRTLSQTVCRIKRTIKALP